MGCQLCLLPPPLCHRHPRRCHLPKVTSVRIIFDKAFRQMKFKWLHICRGIPPTSSPLSLSPFSVGHFSCPSYQPVTCHRSLLNVRSSMFIFISTLCGISLSLFVCLLSALLLFSLLFSLLLLFIGISVCLR